MSVRRLAKSISSSADVLDAVQRDTPPGVLPNPWAALRLAVSIRRRGLAVEACQRRSSPGESPNVGARHRLEEEGLAVSPSSDVNGAIFEPRFRGPRGVSKTTGDVSLSMASRGLAMIRPGDDEMSRPFVFVTGWAGTYSLRGWLRGNDVEKVWLTDFGNGRPPVYAVPRKALRPLR